jgi:hypothetical protein
MPSRLEQQPPRVTVSGLGDRTLRTRLFPKTFTRDQPDLRADRAPRESLPVTDPGCQPNPVNAETPRRRPSRRTIGVYGLFSVISSNAVLQLCVGDQHEN